MTKDLDFLGPRLGAWGPHRATCRDALANATGQRTLSYASGETPCSFVNGRQGVPVRKERAAACRPTPDKARSQGGPRPFHEWRTPRFPSSRLVLLRFVPSWRTTPLLPSRGSANARNTRCSCSAFIPEPCTRLVSRRLHSRSRHVTISQIAVDER